MPESIVLLSVGGGLIARQLRNMFAPRDVCEVPLPAPEVYEPPLLLASDRLLTSGHHASDHGMSMSFFATPTLRIPTSSVNIAAWAIGALLAQVMVMLARSLARRIALQRRGTSFSLHRTGTKAAPRVEIMSTWRGNDGGNVVVNGSPRKCATRVLNVLMRDRDTATAVIVVNV